MLICVGIRLLYLYYNLIISTISMHKLSLRRTVRCRDDQYSVLHAEDWEVRGHRAETRERLIRIYSHTFTPF